MQISHLGLGVDRTGRAGESVIFASRGTFADSRDRNRLHRTKGLGKIYTFYINVLHGISEPIISDVSCWPIIVPQCAARREDNFMREKN